MADKPIAPLIAVARHRLAVDGQGVTTLVAFHGCTLRCRYCLNAQCLHPDGLSRTVTPAELLDEVMIDNLYFLATGGGITFGGGNRLSAVSLSRPSAAWRHPSGTSRWKPP